MILPSRHPDMEFVYESMMRIDPTLRCKCLPLAGIDWPGSRCRSTLATLPGGYMTATCKRLLHLSSSVSILESCGGVRPLLVVLFSQAAFAAGSLEAEIACHGSSLFTVSERQCNYHCGFVIEPIEALSAR